MLAFLLSFKNIVSSPMENINLPNRIHPAFFEVVKPFSKMKKVHTDSWNVEFKSPIIGFKIEDNMLVGEDIDFLSDIYNIIFDNFGSFVSRDEARKLINFKNVPDNVSVVHVGNVFFLEDFFSGWDGGLNCIWFDNECPGEVVYINHSFFRLRVLDDNDNIEEHIKLSDSYINLLELLSEVPRRSKKIHKLLDLCPTEQL